MRLLSLLILLCAASSGFSIDRQYIISPASEPRMKEFTDYYRNGNLKSKTIAILHSDGSTDRIITEAYRKNGTKRYRSVSNHIDLLQYTCYDKQGLMKYERSYNYYHNGTLQSVETRKANGDRQVWTEPPADENRYRAVTY